MSGKPYEDFEAGVRLVFPPDWDVLRVEEDEPADDADWLTTAAFPPRAMVKARRRSEEEYEEGVHADEDGGGPDEDRLWSERPWEERVWSEPLYEDREKQGPPRSDQPPSDQPPSDQAPSDQPPSDQPPSDPPSRAGGHSPGVSGFEEEQPGDGDSDEDPEDWLDLDDLFDYTGCYVGRWRLLPQEPPGEDELAEGADWLAQWYLRHWEFFVPDDAAGLERSVRPARVSGHPATVVRYHHPTNETGETAAYLRLLLVQLPDGPPTFVLGAAQTDADRLIVDACLDTVEALPA